MALKRSPSCWSIGDHAIVKNGRHDARVRICGYRPGRELLEVEYPDRTRGLRQFSNLRPDDE